jgi:hypothetical protein
MNINFAPSNGITGSFVHQEIPQGLKPSLFWGGLRHDRSRALSKTQTTICLVETASDSGVSLRNDASPSLKSCAYRELRWE